MGGINQLVGGGGAAGNAPATTITLIGASVIDITSGAPATAQYTLDNDGHAYMVLHSGTTDLGIWCSPVANTALYECYMTVSYGTLSAGSATGAWLNCGTDRNWQVNTAAPSTVLVNLTLSVRLAGGDGTILDQVNIALECDES